MFRIVIRGRNCSKYLDKCMRSLLWQEGEWRATVIMDAPTDGSEKLARLYESDKVNVFCHKERKGLAYNIVCGVELSGAEPEDVIVILDADDYLLPDALKELSRAYRDKEVLLTYGSFILQCTGKKSRICKPYPKGANVRKYKWRATHLKSFKKKLFDKVPRDYFRYKDQWIPAASDVALMIPLLEVAGLNHCKHLRKPLYFYRNSTPQSVKRGAQRRWERKIRGKKPLQRQF